MLHSRASAIPCLDAVLIDTSNMSHSPSSVPLPVEAFEAPECAFQQSSPLSLRQEPFYSPPTPPRTDHLQSHDYNFSGAGDDGGASGTEPEEQVEVENDQEPDLSENDRRISGSSSISSFPASVLQDLPRRQDQYGSPRTPTHLHSSIGSYPFESPAGVDYHMLSPRSARDYHSIFRHPSSVKALQMNDDAMSDTHSVIRHHRRSGSQVSSYTHRSSRSVTSATKRSSRSNRGSPQKVASNLKKEFPLVLLHCTLLPPTLLFQSTAHEDSLISELLPEEYKKRWIALQDKLVGDLEVRTRGVLIAHPREDYGLLEERLLESLDLEKPRIRHSHFFQTDSSSGDSGFESGSITEDETDGQSSDDVKCPDCGRRVPPDEINRKWEVKVFAANGLMRAGAWSAAWQEMEKVDVEVRVWLPDELRRDLEAQLALLAPEPEPEYLDDTNVLVEPTPREREIYGDTGMGRSQAEMEEFGETPRTPLEPISVASCQLPPRQDMQPTLLAYARQYTQDWKNLLLGLLSLLVLFLALAGKGSSEIRGLALPDATPVKPTPALTTFTTTSVELSTVTVTASPSTYTSFSTPVLREDDPWTSIDSGGTVEQASPTSSTVTLASLPDVLGATSDVELEVTSDAPLEATVVPAPQ